MWGRDYYETTSGTNRDKSVQRSISLVAAEAQSGQNDVTAPFVIVTSFIISCQKSCDLCLFSTEFKLASKLKSSVTNA